MHDTRPRPPNRASRLDGGEQLILTFRAQRAALYAIARSIVGEHDAADVVQDVLVRMLRYPDRFKPERASLDGFLRMVTRTTAIDHLRHRGATRRRDDEHCATTGQEVADVIHDLLRREMTGRVLEALDRLDVSKRDLIVDAFFKRMTHREIALNRGLAEGTVKSRIRAALRQLRVELRELDPAPSAPVTLTSV